MQPYAIMEQLAAHKVAGADWKMRILPASRNLDRNERGNRSRRGWLARLDQVAGSEGARIREEIELLERSGEITVTPPNALFDHWPVACNRLDSLGFSAR
jgi:hypothetical protein